jgi:hypothetical protein
MAGRGAGEARVQYTARTAMRGSLSDAGETRCSRDRPKNGVTLTCVPAGRRRPQPARAVRGGELPGRPRVGRSYTPRCSPCCRPDYDRPTQHISRAVRPNTRNPGPGEERGTASTAGTSTTACRAARWASTCHRDDPWRSARRDCPLTRCAGLRHRGSSGEHFDGCNGRARTR